MEYSASLCASNDDAVGSNIVAFLVLELWWWGPLLLASALVACPPRSHHCGLSMNVSPSTTLPNSRSIIKNICAVRREPEAARGSHTEQSCRRADADGRANESEDQRFWPFRLSRTVPYGPHCTAAFRSATCPPSTLTATSRPHRARDTEALHFQVTFSAIISASSDAQKILLGSDVG